MLIKSIDTLQKYVRINISVMAKSFIPYANDAATKFLLPYLGKSLLLELKEYVDSSDTFPAWASDDEKKLVFTTVLELSQNALAKFTCFLAAPSFDLSLTEMGFVVQHNDTSTPASAERVKKMVQSLESLGWDNIETLLAFLEENHAVIDSYKDSAAFVFATQNFISKASVFNQYVNINDSRLQFIKLRPLMDDVEILTIEPAISAEMAAKLLEQQRGNNLSAANKKLLALVQRCIANITAARYFNDDHFTRFGLHYLAEIKKLLDATPDSYPEYKASALYDADKTSYSLHENTEESQTFIFGG